MEEQFNKLLLDWAKDNLDQIVIDTEYEILYDDDIVAVQNAKRTLHGWLCTITYYRSGGTHTEEMEIPVEYLLGWTWERAGCIF